MRPLQHHRAVDRLESDRLVAPSDELFEHTHALDRLFREHGAAWRSAEYLMSRGSAGNWTWEVSFTYDPERRR